MNQRKNRLIEIANSYVGTKEEGGDNKGKQVEAFQRAIGAADCSAWCLSFVQFCVKKVDSEFDAAANMTLMEHTILAATEHVMTLWDKTDKNYRKDKPNAGDLILWKHYKDGKATGSGHVGIITEIGDDFYKTVEGNTGPDDKGIEREGDGVYEKKRKKTDYTNMRVVGFLSPWKEV